MPRKVYAAEQIAKLLQQIEAEVANGKTHEHACLNAGIAEHTYYRWKARYAGLDADQVREMKALRGENIRLKKLVSALTLDKSVLTSMLKGKS